MAASSPYLEFAPPKPGGTAGALALAVLAHAVLLAVLTLGVQWRSDPVAQTIEAELWSAVPVQAAAPAPPLPAPAPEPKLQPEPAKPPPEPTRSREAAIALEREKQKQKDLAEKRLAQEKRDAEKKKQAELDKQEKLRKEQADRQARAKQEQNDAALLAKTRAEQLKRIEQLAANVGNGAAGSSGSAAQAAAPSASYLGRLIARVKPNIVFSELVSGNPAVEVDVRTSPAGNILSATITRSSGIKAWDDAVLRAIEKTEVLPRDTDGTIPPLIPFRFRPKD